VTALVKTRMARRRMRSGVDHGGAGHSWCYQSMSGVNRGESDRGECSTSIYHQATTISTETAAAGDRISDETTNLHLSKRVARQSVSLNPGSNGSASKIPRSRARRHVALLEGPLWDRQWRSISAKWCRKPHVGFNSATQEAKLLGLYAAIRKCGAGEGS
jgi:hypothetical protein